MADQSVSVLIAADTSSLRAAVDQANSSMTAFFQQVTEHSQGLGSVLEDVRGKLTGVFAFTGASAVIDVVKEIGAQFEEMGQRAIPAQHRVRCAGRDHGPAASYATCGRGDRRRPGSIDARRRALGVDAQ